MKFNPDKSVTLLELLIAMSLLGLLVIGISSIETFSRYQLTSAGIRSRLQSEVSFLLEHMAKNINMAIGDVVDYPVRYPVFQISDGLRIRIDSNKDHRLDVSDKEIAYRFNVSGYPFQVLYYSDYTGPSSSHDSVVAYNITAFTVSPPTSSNNYVEVLATACANPDDPLRPCGSVRNPNVTMTNRIEMPSVSLH
jgi:hypothetical protein